MLIAFFCLVLCSYYVNGAATIADYIVSNRKTKYAASILKSNAAFSQMFNSTSNIYTVFVPTDAAYSELQRSDPEFFDKFTTDSSYFSEVYGYHIVQGSHDLFETKQIILKSIFGDLNNYVNWLDGTSDFRVGNNLKWAQILYRDYVASNGNVYVIDKVLIPYTE